MGTGVVRTTSTVIFCLGMDQINHLLVGNQLYRNACYVFRVLPQVLPAKHIYSQQ